MTRSRVAASVMPSNPKPMYSVSVRGDHGALREAGGVGG